MFKEFFLLEIKTAFKRPMIYIFTFFIVLLSFGAVASDNVQIGGSIGNIYKNAPFAITQFVTTFTLMGIFFAVAFFNNAALRDHSNNFKEILFSAPIHKGGYFFGRFLGALVLSTVPILGIYIGVLLGALIAPAVGWLEPDRIGPFYLETFINNYFLFILPNMFLAGSILYALATKFKNTVISFVGALVLLIAYGLSGTLLSDVDNETLGGLLDSFGLRAYTVYSRYFTPFEKNTLSPAFEGILLWNRLIWIGVGFIVLLLSYLNFSFKEKSKKQKKRAVKEEVSTAKIETITVSPQFGANSNWQHFISFLKISFLNIIKSIVFKVIILFATILLVVDMVSGFEYFGLQAYPITYKVVELIDDSSSLFVIIILIFFSGELVWRDRLSHIHEVINATPHHSLSSFFAKVLTLLGVVSSLYFFFGVLGIFYQLVLGFTNIEFGLYLSTFFIDILPGYLFYSIFFIFIQVMVNHRYQGYFVTILFVFVWSIILSVMDVQSNMLGFGGAPSIQYSDMNGYGPGLLGNIWFNVYWLLFAAILALVAALFWVRSSGGGFKNRLKVAKVNFNGKLKPVFLAVVVLWVASAAYVYYNSQVLNTYQTSDETEWLQVRYEQKYKKYQDLALPSVTDVVYHVDIFPNERDIKVKAEIKLKNKTNQVIDSIHYNLNEDWEVDIQLPNSELVMQDDSLDYRIYALKKPMQPGDEMDMVILSNYETKGFENTRGNTSIIQNGTFINNRSILPGMGYQEGFELSDKNDRKKYDLPSKDRMPELDSANKELRMVNYLTDGRADWVNIETFISTSAEQIAIAPGKLVKEWQEEGRNYYHYKIDQASQLFCSFISADYEVAKRVWNGISLEVYYDEKHDYNIDMMLDAIQKSLEYYTENFGPYYHQQARIIEFPRYATFAQAFPGTMPYSEAFGFIIDMEDSTKNNVVNAVIAHEMAHQWWAHQVIGAKMQGGTMLSESFSEYSSLMVMKQEKDDLGMKEFLKYDFNRYLRGRGRESDKELPLAQVENQAYLHYGKGSLILYALQDYIGEDKVNQALRDFLEEYRYAEPPYPTSLDFLRHLEPQVPDSLHYLIEDWFKQITLYDFRLKEATYEEKEGKYWVELTLENKKLRADTIGNETEAALNDWVDIALFEDRDAEKPLLMKRMKLKSGEQTLTFTVDSKPVKAAIDPKRLLIERVYKDNYKVVEEKEL